MLKNLLLLTVVIALSGCAQTTITNNVDIESELNTNAVHIDKWMPYARGKTVELVCNEKTGTMSCYSATDNECRKSVQLAFDGCYDLSYDKLPAKVVNHSHSDELLKPLHSCARKTHILINAPKAKAAPERCQGLTP